MNEAVARLHHEGDSQAVHPEEQRYARDPRQSGPPRQVLQDGDARVELDHHERHTQRHQEEEQRPVLVPT